MKYIILDQILHVALGPEFSVFVTIHISLHHQFHKHHKLHSWFAKTLVLLGELFQKHEKSLEAIVTSARSLIDSRVFHHPLIQFSLATNSFFLR